MTTPPPFNPKPQPPEMQPMAPIQQAPQYRSAEEEFEATFGTGSRNTAAPSKWSNKVLAILMAVIFVVMHIFFYYAGAYERFRAETILFIAIPSILLIAAGILTFLRYGVGWAILEICGAIVSLIFLGGVANTIAEGIRRESSRSFDRMVEAEEFWFLSVIAILCLASVLIGMMRGVRVHIRVHKALYLVILILILLSTALTFFFTISEGMRWL